VTKIKNGFFYLAKKYLLVLKLGVNLILVRWLCKNEIIKIYDLKNIYFKKLKSTM